MEDESDGSSDRDAPIGRDEGPLGSEGDAFATLRDGPTRLVPVRSEAARRELLEGDRRLLHCLACGRQVVARRHGGTCLLCGSAAVIVETV